MRKLTGRTALITGGTTGIGFSTAKLFMEEGAKVIITGRNPDNLREATGQLSGVIALQSDAADMNSVRGLPKKLRAHVDKLDVVFLNAGAAKLAPAEQITEELYDTVFNINVKCLFFTAQEPRLTATTGAAAKGGAVKRRTPTFC